MRDRMDDLDEALAEEVENPAVVSRQSSDRDAETEADRNPDDADGERDARSIDDARQQIASEAIGPEQEERRLCVRTHEMQVGRDQTPEGIGIAMAEEAQAMDLLAVHFVLALQVIHVEVVVEAIHIRSYELTIVEQV